MLTLVFKALKGTSIGAYVFLSLIWIIFLMLLDLGIFAVTGKTEISAPREESDASSTSQSGCVEIVGVKICD
jgi:uncharacterized membrane protein